MPDPQTRSTLPFLINFVDRIEPAEFAHAIRQMNFLSDTYDPNTQTSTSSIAEGTVLTYRDTYVPSPDTRQDDT